MNIAFRLGILAVALLAPSIAVAADDFDWYVGVERGRTTIHSTFGDLSISNNLGLIIPDDPALTITHSSSLNSTSSKVEAGVWINRYVGLQAGYVDLGTFSESTHFHDPNSNICYGGCSIYSTSDFTDTNKVSVKGLVLAVDGRVPLPEGFALLARLGMFLGNVTYEEDSQGLAPGQLGGSDTIDGSSGDIGLGLGWRFSSHWGVELWRDRFTQMGNAFGSNSMKESQFEVRGYSLSVQYHF